MVINSYINTYKDILNFNSSFIKTCETILKLKDSFIKNNIAFYISDKKNLNIFKSEIFEFYKIFIDYLDIIEIFSENNENSHDFKYMIKEIKDELNKKYNLINNNNNNNIINAKENKTLINILFFKKINNDISINFINSIINTFELQEEITTDNKIKNITNSEENKKKIKKNLKDLISTIQNINILKNSYINNYISGDKKENLNLIKNTLKEYYKGIYKRLEELIKDLKHCDNYFIKDTALPYLSEIKKEIEETQKTLNYDYNNSCIIGGEQNQKELNKKEIINLRLKAVQKKQEEN